jgi:DNA modification methylase
MDIIDTPTEKIRPYENNPRYNEAAIAKVAASIAEFGFQQPIVVDGDGVVIVGHTRLAAAKQICLNSVPVLVASELTPDQVRAYRIADNRTNEDASWNDQLLLEEITSLMEGAYDIELLGFSDEEIQALQSSGAVKEGATDPDEIPEPEGVVISRPGDIWECGRHRVVCGDSTTSAALKTALQSRNADMVWIDPPYNVGYTGKTKKKLKIKNDAMGDGAFLEFMTDTLKAHIKATKKGGCIYMAHAASKSLEFISAMAAAGWENKQTLIWIKNQMVLGRQDYNWKHEPLLYGWKPGAAHYFSGDYTQTTVIDDDIDASKLNKQQLLERYQLLEQQLYNTVHREKRPDVSDVHPTMKPVALVERHIEASSRPGQTILDGFGGSGTTMIAAEKTARKAALVELEPQYVDVIVRRWQAWTEQEATLSETNETFLEVTDGRSKAKTN